MRETWCPNNPDPARRYFVRLAGVIILVHRCESQNFPPCLLAGIDDRYDPYFIVRCITRGDND